LNALAFASDIVALVPQPLAMNQSSKPIRVLYDHQVFTWQSFGGISRYFADLITNLPALSKVRPMLSLKYSDNAHLQDVPSLRGTFQAKRAAGHPIRGRLFRRHRWRNAAPRHNQNHTIELLAQNGHDLFHPTYYETYFWEHLRGKPYVVTVYDLIHEVFPEHYLLDSTVRAKEEVIRRADRVIAISHSTKRDLVEILKVPAEKIDVVQLATAFSPQTCPPAPLDLPARYFLYVGNRGGYKNCYFLLRALREFLRGDSTLHVICAGGGPFENLEKTYLEGLGISHQVHYHEASNASLVALYQRAIALIFPSLYEGFGLPITEAFNCQCPVLSSRAASLVEVAGDAAHYFDAKSLSSIQHVVSRALHEPHFLDALREKGTLRASEFSPERVALETAAVYERVLNRKSAS
jgi:glycosyltransferase involved in cell wall biosynthesis